MSHDLPSLLAGGATLSDLLNAAEIKPTDIKDEKVRAKLAAWALKQFTAFCRNATGKPKAEAMVEWSSLCTPRLMLGLGAQWSLEQEPLMREAFMLGQMPGWSKWQQQLMTMVRSEAKRINTSRGSTSNRRIVTLSERLRDTLGDIADEINLHEDVTCPVGFRVDAGGVWKIITDEDGSERSENLCRTPILITGLMRDVEGEGAYVMIRWRARGRWHQHVCGRKDVLVAAELAQLSAYSVPVSSNSARGLVDWFEAFLHQNESVLAEANTVSHLGWNEAGYMWGKNLITPDGIVMSDLDTGSWDAAPIHLDINKPGLSQMAKGYFQRGTWEEWCSVVSRVRHHPRFGLAILAAISPPILKHLPEAPNFVLDFGGETSRGKTTALRLAASVWGSPSERDNGLVWSWDATQTWIERAAAFVCDMPLILDDSKRAKPERVSSIVYAVAQGMGRGRATVQGLQEQTHWRTVLLSTGEAPLTHYATEGGASARILSMWGTPFSKHEPQAHGEIARLTSRDSHRYHGHLGPRIVQMLNDPGVVSALRDHYDKSVDEYSDMLKESPIGGRIAQYLGVLSCAEFLYQRTGAPQFIRSPITEAYGGVASSMVSADRATAAMADMLSYLASMKTHLEKAPGVQDTPSNGWIGRWSGGDMWDLIGIRQDITKDRLRMWGYDSAAILATWKERGWTKCDSTHVTSTMQLAGSVVRLVVIKYAAKNEVENKAKHAVLEMAVDDAIDERSREIEDATKEQQPLW